MNSSRQTCAFFRLSLRELMLLLAFLAVGCAGLKYAGEMWWVALSLATLVGFQAAVVIAVVGRGPSQARAIGFVLCIAVYAVLLWSAPVSSRTGRSLEFDPALGRLPTTKLLRPVFELVVTQKLIDADTGRAIPPDYAAQGITAVMGEVPNRGPFMLIGHLLWALALGYLGNRLAGWLYSWRTEH